jgi:phage terminase small subunit
MASGDQVTHGLLVKGSDGVTANPLVGIAHRAAADMVRYAGEFGMSPSARARIAAGPFESQTPSKFAGLLGGYDDERA